MATYGFDEGKNLVNVPTTTELGAVTDKLSAIKAILSDNTPQYTGIIGDIVEATTVAELKAATEDLAQLTQGIFHYIEGEL